LNAREKEIKFLEENVVGINKQLKKNILNKYKPKEILNLEERLQQLTEKKNKERATKFKIKSNRK